MKMSFTPWFFSHNSHHHLIMRKHQAGPPPTPKPPAPTTSPMELLTQRERWETFRKWRDLRCKGTVNFRWTSWARGTTKGCPCGEVHWSPPTCASWVTAAGCTLGSSSTTDSAPCSCWARRASARIISPEPALHGSRSRCRAQSFHASALRQRLRRRFAKLGQGSMVHRVVAEHDGGHGGAQGPPLPRIGRDRPQGAGNLHEGPRRGGPRCL